MPTSPFARAVRKAASIWRAVRGLPRYPKYKDSGVEWLGEVPEHWQVKRLRFVAEINPSKSEISHLDREILVSFLPMEAIGDEGSLDLEREKTVREVETGYLLGTSRSAGRDVFYILPLKCQFSPLCMSWGIP
jgi:hypothetical protein